MRGFTETSSAMKELNPLSSDLGGSHCASFCLADLALPLGTRRGGGAGGGIWHFHPEEDGGGRLSATGQVLPPAPCNHGGGVRRAGDGSL